MREDLLKILQSHWSDLLEDAQEISFRKGQVLFYEGHVPCGLFVVAKGSVSASSHPEDLDEESWTSPQGLVVGLAAALEGRPSRCTIAASEDSTLLFIPKSSLVTHIRLSERAVDDKDHVVR